MTRESIRNGLERPSIRKFMEDNSEYLTGNVLDFGCGDMPYRDLVKGDYFTYEKGEMLPEKKFNCIMCNQVIQYVNDPDYLISTLDDLLEEKGYLIITYPTIWEEFEEIDYWRITKAGMEKLLIDNNFKIIKHDERWSIKYEDFKLSGGYGVVAQKC